MVQGNYQGIIDISRTGVYTVTVMQYDSFSEEDGEELLRQVSQETGGRMAYTASGILEYQGDYMEQELNITLPLLVTVMVLFLSDIVVRKFKLRRRV